MPPPKGTFHPTKKLERAYSDGVSQIVKRVLPPRKKDQTLDEWLGEIAAASQRRDVIEASETLAQRMCHWVSVGNMKTWREAAEKSQQSLKLFSLLKAEMQGTTGRRVRELVLNNAAYIRSIPLVQAQRLTAEVQKAQANGARPATIEKMMRTRWPELLRSRVKLIARTETAKASAALTRARCDDLSLDWVEWLTSEDARVRVSHKKMDKVLFRWSDMPDPEALVGEKPGGHYGPGEVFNCRCSSAPLLSASDLSWPRRVYANGSIKQMTLQQFKALSGMTERAAA